VRHCYPALVSYVVDTPEDSDNGCTVHSHCPRGYTARPDFASEEKCVPRCPHDTLKRLDELEVASTAAEVRALEKNMRIVGITSIRPALLSWPFMELCAALALPKLLRFETLHNFYLGLSRSLKVAVSEMLKEDSLLTTELLNAKGSARKLKSARVDILKKCSAFLRRVNTDSPCVGLNFDFSKAGTNEVLSGLFTATGIAARLEAKDLAGVDQVMPFVFVILDRLCGATAAAPNTTVCVLYQEMVATATSRFSEPGFTIAELEAISEQISQFKAKAIEVFGRYRRSGMAFPKFHALQHVVEDIRECGSLFNFTADSYETSHKQFKDAYKQMSNRKGTGQDDALERMVRAQCATDASTAAMDMRSIPLRGHAVAKLMGKCAASIRLTEEKGESMEKDNPYLSNGGERMTWSQIRAHAEACDGKHSSGESLAPGCERAIELLCDDVGGPQPLAMVCHRDPSQV
jgi:Plavaka transposase